MQTIDARQALERLQKLKEADNLQPSERVALDVVIDEASKHLAAVWFRQLIEEQWSGYLHSLAGYVHELPGKVPPR